jgi:chorismate mutase/prephenate dehydratase
MSLDELRKEIDAIDEALVRLLNRRAEKALTIGEDKKKQGSPIHDPDRESEVLSRVRKLSEGPLSEEALNAIYREIVAACLDIQNRESHNEA